MAVLGFYSILYEYECSMMFFCICYLVVPHWQRVRLLYLASPCDMPIYRTCHPILPDLAWIIGLWLTISVPPHAESNSLLCPGPGVFLHSWVVIRSAQDKQIDYDKCIDEHERYCILISIASSFIVRCIQASKYALLINVRTEDTRFTSRAFTLASSRTPPKPVGSALAVHPTADH